MSSMLSGNTEMTTIFKDAADLHAAMEANYFAYFKCFSQLPYMELQVNPEITCLISSTLHHWNTVLRTQITTSDVVAKVKATLAYFDALNLPLMWHILPSTRPSDLGHYLEASGLKLVLEEPHMAVDLSKLSLKPPVLPDLVIECVHDKTSFDRWYQATAAGFFATSPVRAQIYFDAYTMLGFNPEGPLLHYVGYLHGEPVTSSTLLLAEGIAGIYDVSTVPAARGQRLGTAITQATLLEARMRGYSHACLQATQQGYNVYRRLDFEEQFMQRDYLWHANFATI